MNSKRLFTIIYSYFILVLFELMLCLFCKGAPNIKFLYTMLLCIPGAGVLYILSSLFPPLVNKILYNLSIFIISVYLCVQVVYHSIFGSYMSISSIGMGGDAIENFKEQVLTGIKDSAFAISVMLVITVATVLLTVFSLLEFDRFQFKFTVINIAAVFILHFACVSLLAIGGTGAYTVYDAYHSADTSTDNAARNLGILTTSKLELQQMIFKDLYAAKNKNNLNYIDGIPSYSKSEYNVSDIDFNAIISNCDSAEAAELTATLAKRQPTKKNQYTGVFKDCNLITICAESFSPYLIDPVRTPTLYKLANEGFVFKNFYGSYDSVTTNGEYTFCLGMFPDLSRSKKDNSFIASAHNALPYALGNQFKGVGADTYAYHNFIGSYYSRNITHPNMGYDLFKAPDSGLNIAPTWPSSDYDMMVQSVDDYIDSGKRFHTYYMTFSGHYQYDWKNIMCARNKSLVKDLDFPTAVKAYIASNMELEKALTYLMERLESAGIADNTVIVLTTDHYPYGLTDYEYSQLAGFEVETEFEKYRNSFICWKGGMEEPVVVDNICSTIDILPTLLNLFGFEYDSRLIMGKDVLADSGELAILANQSFITPDYRFNAAKNELIVTTDAIIDEADVEETKNYVKDLLATSRAILNTDFYQYITEE